MRSALFQLDTMEVLVSILASGACEKYPDFNFVLGESGVTWLPYVFDRLDTEYHDRARSLGFKMKPSDYFRRQGYVTYQQDKYLEPIVPLIGEDNIIWGADYPHPDCIWPNSRETLTQNLAELLRQRAEEDRPRQRGAAVRAELIAGESWSSGPRASRSLMTMSERDARGPKEHDALEHDGSRGIIKAPRHAVYRACLDPDALARWRVPDNMTARVHVFDAREGGGYRMSLTYRDPQQSPGGKTSEDTDTFQGRFVELVPDEKIVEAIEFESRDTGFAGEMKVIDASSGC